MTATHARNVQKVIAALHGTVPQAVPDVDGLRGWSIHLPHPEAPAAAGARPVTRPSDVTAVVMAWIAGDDRVDPAPWFDGPATAYLVEERVQIEWSRDWPDRTPTPGVEQISFVRRIPDLTRARFAAHWSERHARLVPRHHPGVARYVQNVVVEPLTEGAPEIDGIAQLYFRTALDMRERFYDSEEGRRIVGEDVARFIDRDKGWGIIAQETWLRS